ncbi:ComEC/Rec2 family competence protein [Confluentibacter flavum]|uniref:Competence protein n=1 Tax=Confluentibacter flavum TaxID=1909700 RepID=A0A2N3HFX0_9FLAO|nr:ComEC/Rec2 family competence protein [Confluentibacter flavum]PKQ43879.1 competence protein [Confluentibacter flavum]
MKLLNFTIIKLTICLITGILIGYFFVWPLTWTLYITTTLLILLFLFYTIAKKQFLKTIWFGLLAFIAMIFIGILTINIHNEKNFSNHYTHFTSENDSLKIITFRIKEVLKSNIYYDKYVIDILKIGDLSVSGKSLLNLQKDSTQVPLKVDDLLITKTVLKDIVPPLNPNQFNYKKFLEKKYIYHQLFTNKPSLLKVESEKNTFLGKANSIRTHINTKLKTYPFNPDELAIINALLLGQRQDISEEVYSNYTNAGAIHILAVSGLHIGIILLILSFILKPLEQFKQGKLVKTILLIGMLWGFAVIAGLSASVTRAVTMFSIVAIAMNLKRPTSIFNTLAISMFVLLLIKPMFLFDVGFQLSYLAVFSIVIIDPLLYNLWKPKNKILDFYWHTLTVTVSAQFGILPISLYYFHQLPALFFISNLVIIPVLGIILGFGILIIFLALLNILPVFLAKTYGYTISLMTRFVGWISQQEQFLFKDVAFSLLYVFVSYFLIIAMIQFWKQKHYKNYSFLLIAVLVIQCALIYTKYNSPKNQFVIFHKSRFTLVGNVTSNTFHVNSDFDSLTFSKDRIIRDFVVGNHIKTIQNNTFNPIYLLNSKTLLVIDSLGVYNIKSFEPDYVLLRQSPQLNLNRLIDSIKPKYIIADGSNYKSYLEHWEAICQKRKLPFHQTSKKGAFIINY